MYVAKYARMHVAKYVRNRMAPLLLLIKFPNDYSIRDEIHVLISSIMIMPVRIYIHVQAGLQVMENEAHL